MEIMRLVELNAVDFVAGVYAAPLEPKPHVWSGEDMDRPGRAVLFQFGLLPFYLRARMPVLIKERFKHHPLEFKVCTVHFMHN